MENFIKLLLQTSLSMSVVIILFFIITNSMIKVYHTKTFYYCCIIILLGLIIPFRFININLINVNITDKININNKITKNYAPEQIKNWIKECDKEKEAYFYKLNNDDKLDIWIYYNKGGSYPWNIDYKDGNIEFYLYDMPEINGNEGYTLINCQTLNKKDNIKLYFNDILISSN